ncbi:MAG TPA: hypothetical protein VHI13_03810 [Candidatus Kapabacteria bacterium]|nr:hypothetical protein [Candidatus Kapabacteria bacterium]
MVNPKRTMFGRAATATRYVVQRYVRRIPAPALLLLCAALCSMQASAQSQESPSHRTAWPATPSSELRFKALKAVADDRANFLPVAAAKLRLNIDTAFAWQLVDTFLTHPVGDMFWLYPAVGFYFHCKDRLNSYWRGRFRGMMKSYSPYRGDTENHYLMYYSAILLFSQEWPELGRDEWFNGKSSAENYADAKEYLDHWIDDVAANSVTEWDSPRYVYLYITPLLVLRDFTNDPLLRRRVDMMIEYLLADFAAEYLNGSYCGAHSRHGDNSVIDPRRAEAGTYAGFYFEDSLAMPNGLGNELTFAALSGFQCPPIIRAIAHDRDTAFVHTELKRSRAKMRSSSERYTLAGKYDFMTPDYCLGSVPGGLLQPIQQHSWDVTFASPKPNNTIFGLHPQWSAMEAGMFFPEEPELIVGSIAKTKGSYTNENKWVGGSPYEHIVQYRNTLAALYVIPAGASTHHVDLFLPKSLDECDRSDSGWIFCRMGGAFVAIYPLAAERLWMEEKINWRLRLPAPVDSLTGYVVECARSAELSFAAFKAAHREPPRWCRTPHTDDNVLDVRTWRGTRFSVEGSRPDSFTLHVDGGAVNTDASHLFNGPNMYSITGSRVIELRAGNRRRILDFNRNTISE